MAVTKRTRFEVLKRDNSTCRYCGATAPDAILTVDHVTPIALGGTDDPSNLVAACRDCNYGKASTSPDAAVVDDVKQADLRWAAAMKRAGEIRAVERSAEAVYMEAFDEIWVGRSAPTGYTDSLIQMRNAGLPVEELRDAARIALGNRGIEDRWRYFCGISWKKVAKLQEIAKSLLEVEAVD